MASQNRSIPQVAKRKNFKFTNPSDECCRGKTVDLEDMTLEHGDKKSLLPPVPNNYCHGKPEEINFNLECSENTDTSVDDCGDFFDEFENSNALLATFFENRRMQEMAQVKEITEASQPKAQLKKSSSELRFAKKIMICVFLFKC